MSVFAIVDDAAEILSNKSLFETDTSHYLYGKTQVAVLNNTTVKQYEDNSIDSAGWVNNVLISDTVSELENSTAQFLIALKSNSEVAGVSNFQIIDVSLAQYGSDVKDAVDNHDTLNEVSVVISDNVNNVLSFMDTYPADVSYVSEFSITDGTSEQVDLSQLLVLAQSDIYIEPSFNVEAQTTAAELFDFYNDGIDKVSAVRIADSIEITSGASISIGQFNNLKTLESVEFGADSVDISDSAQNVIR